MNFKSRNFKIFFLLLVVASVFTTFVYARDIESFTTNSYDSSYSEDNSSDASEASQPNDQEEKIIYEDEQSVGNPGLKSFFYKAILILLIFTGLFFILKAVSFKMNVKSDTLFNERPDFFDGITSKFKGTISNFEGLRLKQVLCLGGGQNLYLVELDGRKMLLGGTHQGGIQYVSDLSDVQTQNLSAIQPSNQSLHKQPFPDFMLDGLYRSDNKEVGLETLNNINFMPDELSDDPFKKTDEHMGEIEKDREKIEIVENEKVRKLQRKPFKRRVNFRQTLISS